jgi:hypothetical protein
MIFKRHTKSKPASVLGIGYLKYGTLGKSLLDKVMLLSKGTVIAKHSKISRHNFTELNTVNGVKQ